MKVFVLMTQWKDGDPGVSGVFSSFDRAAAYFVRMTLDDAPMTVEEMHSEVTRIALKLAHMTDDEDYADFGNMRGWIEEHEVNAHCEALVKRDEG